MASKDHDPNSDQFTPIQSHEEWLAQGWATESEPFEVSPRLAITVSVRFEPDGAAQLSKAASLKGMTKSEFIRKAALREAHRALTVPEETAAEKDAVFTYRVVENSAIVADMGVISDISHVARPHTSSRVHFAANQTELQINFTNASGKYARSSLTQISLESARRGGKLPTKSSLR